MSRPTFTATIKALRCADPRFPWVTPTDEEDDIAAVLEAIEEQHQPTGDEPAAWGRCTGCRSPWPCPEWIRGGQLAVLWLGRAADRYHAHAIKAARRERPA